MELLALLSCVLAAAIASNTSELIDRNFDERWAHFKREHNKKYRDRDHELGRRLIWQKNMEAITEHNRKTDLGHFSYRLGPNAFTDLTNDELQKRFLGGVRPETTRSNQIFRSSEKALPETVDWRDEGYVTPVKDQGQCGSCWAFSAAGSIEGQHFRATGELRSVSPQQLVDCVLSVNSSGCHGGTESMAFESVIRVGGIMLDEDYEYYAQEQMCVFDPRKVYTRLSGYVHVPTYEEALKEAVATIGPISVEIDVTNNFMYYESGIFYDWRCSRHRSKHAVLVVGYGGGNGTEYWTVKNSWGTSWGENGYIRLRRNARNLCGIANHASYPIIFREKDSNAPTLEVSTSTLRSR